MGLTGGVKSHRLSGQISPYCEKKNVIGSARIARLCFYNASLCNQCGVLTPYLKSGTCIYTVSLAMFLPAAAGFSYAQMCLLRLLHPLLLPQMHHTRTRPRDDLDL